MLIPYFKMYNINVLKLFLQYLFLSLFGRKGKFIIKTFSFKTNSLSIYYIV